MNNKKNKILGLFLCLFLVTACSNTLKSVKEGEAFSQSSDGLLVGAIRFQQGDRVIVPSGLGATQRLFIQSIEMGKSFEHVLKGTDFRLALPPGHYTVKRIFAFKLTVNKTTAAAVVPLLLGVLTLPYGGGGFTINSEFNFYPPYSPFEIKQHEATYIGTLVVEIPDPMPLRSFTPTFRVIDEEEQVSKDLLARFPGIERVNKVLLDEPRDANAYIGRGNTYYNKGEYDKAISDYNKAIEIDPKLAMAYSNRGYVYVSKGAYDNATDDFNEALEIDPKDAFAYNGRGVTYVKKGFYDLATADFNKAIEIDPKFAIAYSNRGYVGVSKGEFDNATADFNKAIEIDPKFAIAYHNRDRGYAYYSKGEYDNAIADFNKAIEIDPKFAIAYNTRGLAYYSKGDYDKAIADFNKALEINPKDAISYNERGNTYVKKGLHDLAIADYNKSIEIDPMFAMAYHNKARALEQADHLRDAVEAYKAFIQHAPAQSAQEIVAAKRRIRELEGRLN